MCDRVLELSHITRPLILVQHCKRFFGNGRCPRAGFSCLSESVRRQKREVFGPLTQRRNAECDDAQAIVEVLSESAFLYLSLQIAVRSRKHAHVNPNWTCASDPSHLAFLQHPQQLYLNSETCLADLVQEDCSCVCFFKQPALVGGRASEASFYVPEQLRLEQRLGDRTAVNSNKGCLSSGTISVQCACYQFFSGS